MYTAEVLFKRNRGVVPQDAESAMWSFLIGLLENGQILDRDLVAVPIRGGYKAVVGLSERDSLRPRLFSKRVRERLRAMKMAGIQLGTVRVLGKDLDAREVCKCCKPSAYILGDGGIGGELHFNCGDCWGVVPLYRIPHTSTLGDYSDIRYWAARYRTLDMLWIWSSVGEQFAYRELSRYDSDLSKLGRGICHRIQKNTGIPTYYYLYRWYARSVTSEKKISCPNCGKKWFVDPAWLDKYDFRCARCRLVSNIGSNVW